MHRTRGVVMVDGQHRQNGELVFFQKYDVSDDYMIQ